MKKVETVLTEHENVELMTKTKFDYITKGKLLKAFILGYLREDPDIRSFVNKLKENMGVSKKKRERQAVILRKTERFYDKHSFTDEEITNIFDLIESEGIDL
jgi:hypothetical protein